MNLGNKITSAFAMLFILASANVSQAAWSTAGKVEYVNVYPGGFKFVVDRTVSTNNPVCPNSDPGTQYTVQWSTVHSKQLYATILMSKAAGVSIEVNYACPSTGPDALTTNIGIR